MQFGVSRDGWASPAHGPRPHAVVTGLLTVVLLLAACSDGTSSSTTGGPGPLWSPESGLVGFNDFTRGTDKSFGLFVCVESDPVQIQDVEPVSIEGEVEFLGAYIYSATDGFIGAVDGYPPDGLDDSYLGELPGATVDTPCSSDVETRSQVVVGVSRTGSGGGRIEGLRINHDQGSLELPGYAIALCGDEMEYCDEVESDL